MAIKKKCSKRYKVHFGSYSAFQSKTVDEAVDILKKTNHCAKFVETVDLCVILPLDTRKSDQTIKSYINFPNNFREDASDRSGVVFFCDSKDFSLVEKSGVMALDETSFSDVKEGKIVFKTCYCFAEYLPKLVPLARFLGPKGLMPNVKLGTAIDRKDLEETFSNSARISFRTSSDSSVKIPVGKMDMTAKQISENIVAFLSLLSTLKPASVKNFYIKNLYLSSTMGCSIEICLRNFN